MPPDFLAGFTGTRRGVTEIQRRWITLALQLSGATALIHGGCIGADEAAHRAARKLGLYTIVYPGPWEDLRGDYSRASEIWAPMNPLVRNRIIVRECRFLIACPGEATEVLRSGTWSTVRYARQLGRLRLIVPPDGAARVET